MTEEELQILKALLEEERASARPDDASGTGGATWVDRARATAQGITAGFSDEAIGAINATLGTIGGVDPRPWGDIYRDERDRERAAQAAYAEQEPFINMALQAGGTIAGGGLAAARGAALLPGAARAVRGAAPMYRTLGAGGAVGALEGVGRTEADLAMDPAGVGQAAAGGALLGAVTGGLGAAATNLAGRIAAPIRDRLLRGTRSEAQAALDEVLKGQRATVADVAADIAEAGPGARAADAGALTQAARETVPYADAQRLLRDRLEAQGPRVLAVADEVASDLGVTPNAYRASARRLAKEQSDAAKLMYRAAYAHPNPTNPALLKLLERPSVKQAFVNARKTSLDEGEPLPQMVDFRGSQEPEDWVFTEVPGWREWDLIQRHLRIAAERAGEGARPDRNLRRVLRNVRSEVLDELDTANPQFGDARRVFAGYQAVRDAMELGRDTLGTKVDLEELREIVDGMTRAEKVAMATGLMKAINDKVGRVRDTANLYTAMLNTPDQRAKLALVLGNDGADRVLAELERTGRQIGVARELAQGSSTARQQAARAAMAGGADANVMGAAMRGDLMGAAQGMVNQTLSPGLSEGAKGQIGEVLASPDPRAFEQLMAARSVLGPVPEWMRRQMAVVNPGAAAMGGALGGVGAAQYQR